MIKQNKSLINDNYVKPDITATDLLSKEQIISRLKNYEQVIPTIKNLPVSSRIQYFEILDTDNFRYKPGGTVIVNKYPKYLVLTNGRKNWSVQIKSHVIFKQKDVSDIENNYETIIRHKNNEIRQLNKKNKDLLKKIKILEKELKRYI